MATGAWFYLWAKEQKTHLLALVGGATAAMWIVVVAKWVLAPIQSWPVNLETTRLFESLRTIGSWIVTIAALMAPALLKLLPPSPNQIVDEGVPST